MKKQISFQLAYRSIILLIIRGFLNKMADDDDYDVEEEEEEESNHASKRAAYREYNNSAGNKFGLRSKKAKQTNAGPIAKISEANRLSDNDILHLLTSPAAQQCCCLIHNCLTHNVAQESAEINRQILPYSSAINLFRSKRLEISRKSKTERNTFIKELFCCGADGLTTSYAQRFNIPGYTHLCKNSVQMLYDLTDHEVRKTVAWIKQHDSVEQARKGDINHKPFTESTQVISDLTYSKCEEIFRNSLAEPTIDPIMVESSLVGMSDIQQFCYIHIRDEFLRYGDHSPNSKNCCLSFPSKKTMWEEYIAKMNEQNQPSVNQSEFNALWNTLLPHDSIRPWKAVPGKCKDCYEIDQQRQANSNNSQMKEALAHLHLLHRGGLFMPERISYKERVAHALANPKKVMSIIVDGMDQSHCRIPHFGSQDSFSATVTQHLLGCLRHGKGAKLYRSFNHLKTGANLTIYAILRELEDFKRENDGQYPEILYVQVDGGSENANQFVIAYLEYLVIKRICKKIVITRLPTGHTHEDIDGVFGVIWRWMRQRCITTIDMYAKELTAALEHSRLNIEVEDVYVIPKYDEMIEGHFDSKFGLVYNKDQTKHQWRFDAVEIDIFFPTGVKTTCRGYASPKVIILVKNDKAVSRIGQLTGLEPKTHIVCDHPQKDLIPGRPVEGFYLLRSVMEIKPDAWLPADFDESAAEEYTRTMASVRNKWKIGSDLALLDSWEQWYSSLCPRDRTATEYVQAFPMIIPLRLVFQKGFLATPSWANTEIAKASTINPGFEWPTELSADMPSFRSEWTPNPLPSRHFGTSTILLDERSNNYILATAAYYEGAETSYNAATLTKKLQAKTSITGEEVKLKGNKKTLVDRLRQSDKMFFTAFCRIMAPENEFLIDALLRPCTSVAELDKVHAFWDIPSLCVMRSRTNIRVSITRKMIQNFNIGKSLSLETMNAAASLLDKQEAVTFEKHRARYSEGVQYKPYPRCSFFSADVIHCMMQTNIEDALEELPVLLFSCNVSVFFAAATIAPGVDADNDWLAIIVNLRERALTIVIPSLILTAPIDIPEDLRELADTWMMRINELIGYGSEEAPHELTKVRFLHHQSEHDFYANECFSSAVETPRERTDSGMFLLSYFKFYIEAVPFSCNADDYQHQRRRWLYFMLHGQIH